MEFRPAKTAWDWLQLAVVPIAIAIIAVGFGAFQACQDRAREEDRTRDAQELASQVRQANVLDAYLARMSELMLDRDLLSSRRGSDVRVVARATTLTTLQRQDGDGRGQVVRFLAEAGLIGPIRRILLTNPAALRDDPGWVRAYRRGEHPIVQLEAAELRNANLSNADLTGADLDSADMRKARLSGASLHGARLEEADLRDANLDEADLEGASLGNARLDDASFRGAYLRDASLGGACLTGARFVGADLQGALMGALGSRIDVTRAKIDEDWDLFDASISKDAGRSALSFDFPLDSCADPDTPPDPTAPIPTPTPTSPP